MGGTCKGNVITGAAAQVAASATFESGQKKKAGDICKRGIGGDGYIEGKVYDRGAITERSWEFLLTVELGYRVHILLSGDISNHFDSLPLAVGAVVHLSLRGLSLEVLPEYKVKPLVLRKKFIWCDGIAIQVHNPKTEQDAFLNTWSDVNLSPISHPSPRASSNHPQDSSPSITSKKRKRTPSPSADHLRHVAGDSNAVPATNTGSGLATGTVDVMEIEAPGLTTDGTLLNVVPEAKDTGKVLPSEKGSRNPQSLPSPPPELLEARELESRARKLDRAQASGITSEPNQAAGPSFSSAAPPMSGVLEGGSIQAPGAVKAPKEAQYPTELLRHPPDTELGHLSGPPPQPHTAQKSVKVKVKKKDIRKLKQLRKAGKLTGQTGAVRSDVDESDEDYWAAAPDIPDELLVDVAEVEETKKSGAIEAAERSPTPVSVLQPEGTETAQVSNTQPRKLSEANVDPAESLRMGCSFTFGSYTPLIELRGGSCHVMGIVSSVSPVSRTKKGEFMTRVNLYDSTNFATSGLNVTLFDKSERTLPRPDTGDVLLLRSIFADNFNGASVVGASFKGWQCAVFCTQSGSLSSAPPVDGGNQRNFQPEGSEWQYAVRLSDWWKGTTANASTFGIDTILPAKRVRPHKLISEAEVSEFFDCTVEVLHGQSSGGNVYSVFVTDYTHNPSAAPVQAAWCPPKLAEVVLQVELWDSSASVGPEMQAGELYSLRNMRVKVSAGGFLEGTMQEANKILKLDEDALEGQPHLVELLKRKKEWEAKASISGAVYEFPHQLVEEVEEHHHFNCTVEVVHASSREECLYLYVTDYTARSDLVPVSATIAPDTLSGRIVRISLFDAQVDTAKNLEAGDFVAIRNLRLRPSDNSALLSGRLGGDQRLITKLNPKGTGNADLRELLRRKETFELSRSKQKPGEKNVTRSRRQLQSAKESKATSSSCSAQSKSKGKEKEHCISLRDVKASEDCPAVFRVRARAVDFFPDDLRDCTILRCTNCNETIPKTRWRCTKCDDAMEDETFVRTFFQLFFRMADEDGTTLDVTVSDPRCSVLQDLDPDDVNENDDAFGMFVARVKPLLGTLLDARDGEARRHPLDQDSDALDSPMLDLTLGSWLPDGEPDTTESRAYVILKHAVSDADG